MTATETNDLRIFRNELNSTAAWIELWEVRASDTEVFNITSNLETVLFDSVTYYPFPITRAEIDRDSVGNITDVRVSIANIDRLVQARIETGELLGRTVILRLVNSAILATAANAYTERFEILDATATDIAVTFRLGKTNLFDKPFPANRFTRTRCGWVYGGAECGYDTTRSGALSTCAKTLADCTLHGDDEATAGKPRHHPLRFGGFPGIMKGPYA